SGGGGTSAMSGGVLYLGGGTKLQRACGFEDSPEEMFKYLMAACGPGPDEAKIRLYCDRSVEHFHWLVAQGVGAGDVVGICLERSSRMVAAMLAVMRLGAAYVPLDPSNPAERLHYIATDSRARAVLGSKALLDGHGFAAALAIDDLTAAEIAAAPEVPVVAGPAAYIAYTSGSTGKPKGVIGTHRATINRFCWMWREFPFTPGEVLCQKTAISFVDSVWEIFGPLLAGVAQVIVPAETARDPARLLALLGARKVTRLLLVPSLLRSILDAGIDLTTMVRTLSLVFTSGERIPADLAQRFCQAAPQVKLVNLYGSSEVAADVTCEVVGPVDGDEVPIGRPIDNARLYVLDAARQPVAVGDTGELYVGGEVLAAGYLNRPDLTAERFVPDPFASTPDAVMFATGDRVRYLSDGRLLYLGRNDHQVKVRGARVELGEVEEALAGQPGVAEAVVVARPDHTGETMLVAFVTGAAGLVVEPHSLRGNLALTLPDYMLPARIMVLDAIPLNPSGKVDRSALVSLPLETSAHAAEAALPATATERDLHEIWTRIIGQPNIGVEDDFFELGGHSLMAVKLFAQIRKRFGADLPISTLFAHPTIRSLAECLTVRPPVAISTGFSARPKMRPGIRRPSSTPAPVARRDRSLWSAASVAT
ncbi:MAG: amino acid adenylation domain-containing protein, partial [Tabrizicola sp.]|nr:amino acid adenylation domain-containing protein [Tabrizicola sp.]